MWIPSICFVACISIAGGLRELGTKAEPVLPAIIQALEDEDSTKPTVIFWKTSNSDLPRQLIAYAHTRTWFASA